jgi:hypothetical protein
MRLDDIYTISKLQCPNYLKEHSNFMHVHEAILGLRHVLSMS